ncbi:hypothetical protein HUE87_11395 [Candidatus Sulfurimonas marisnigri]|uniref:TerC family integral membrane protein n=1 Tax=Candidatus Sulfurimonas marisnigri TaxID=2740405 RepID=A0A7S7LZV1_9BACT|nr:hypothetical protein [Candidatus Sulfurimonas marisnigri]QOY54466.1 hypothetical protein HUE87_11395 [Candidatus Sulfurimonas marisnigri]
MNEMYDMSIVTHNYGVMSVLGVILINVFMLLRAKDITKYRRFMRLFMPIGSIAISVIIFTGIVMMAAKHLEFTLANIAMIIFALAIIVLEVKRSSRLKYLNKKEQNAFSEYKIFALKVLFLEVLVTLSISFWMWI